MFDLYKTSNNYFNLKFQEIIKKDYQIRNYDSLLLGFPQMYLCEKQNTHSHHRFLKGNTQNTY